jgi:hypothetical protein
MSNSLSESSYWSAHFHIVTLEYIAVNTTECRRAMFGSKHPCPLGTDVKLGVFA